MAIEDKGAGPDDLGLKAAEKASSGPKRRKRNKTLKTASAVAVLVVSVVTIFMAFTSPQFNTWVSSLFQSKVAATFSHPGPGASLVGQEQRVTLNVTGYEEAKTTLWVVVKAEDRNYYPLPSRLEQRNGEFNFPVILGRKIEDRARFTIIVLSLTESADNALVDHLESDPEGDDGLRALPDGTNEIASLSVHRDS